MIEEYLGMFDPDRCRCQLGTCHRRGTVDGLCDECWLEYAAFRNAYLGPEEWH